MINRAQTFDTDAAEADRSFSLNTPVLATERLILRMPVMDDAEELAVIANNREIAEMTAQLPHPYTRADAEAFIGSVLAGDVDGYTYAITIAETGQLIGMCGVSRPARHAGLAVGYWLGRAFWGKGYASEAATAVVDLAFRVTGTGVIYAGCRTNNTRSRQVLLKQGFERIGVEQTDTVAAGTVATERYRLDRENWLGRKTGAG